MSSQSHFSTDSKEKMLRKALLGGVAAMAVAAVSAPSSAWAVNCASGGNYATTGGSVAAIPSFVGGLPNPLGFVEGIPPYGGSSPFPGMWAKRVVWAASPPSTFQARATTIATLPTPLAARTQMRPAATRRPMEHSTATGSRATASATGRRRTTPVTRRWQRGDSERDGRKRRGFRRRREHHGDGRGRVSVRHKRRRLTKGSKRPGRVAIGYQQWPGGTAQWRSAIRTSRTARSVAVGDNNTAAGDLLAATARMARSPRATTTMRSARARSRRATKTTPPARARSPRAMATRQPARARCAQGNNSQAQSAGSLAFGDTAVATNANDAAIGSNTQAQGGNSFAAGGSSTANLGANAKGPRASPSAAPTEVPLALWRQRPAAWRSAAPPAG